MPHDTLTAYCPRCDRNSPFSLHHDGMKRQKRIPIKPILPTCLACGAAVEMPIAPVSGRQLIALTGTCASGKSTTAQVLIARYGFSGIDGNGVMDVLRHRDGLSRFAFNGPEMLAEIAREIDILLTLERNIVLSHVIIPADLPAYRALFCRRELQYRIVVLQPRYAAAVARSKTRTCFDRLTGEEWIRHFHDAMAGFAPQEDVVIVDNTDQCAEATAGMIMRLR